MAKLSRHERYMQSIEARIRAVEASPSFETRNRAVSVLRPKKKATIHI